MNPIVIILSACTFIFYGSLCLMTNHMKVEFERYGLSRFRIFIGVLELLGGIGLIVGLTYPPILIFSSAGLTLLMILGTFIRIKVRDKMMEILPAFILILVNAFILLRMLSIF